MTSVNYWAVLTDKTGCEFGAGCNAETREDAYRQISEAYPESRIVQLESPEDTLIREQAIYARINEDYDYEEDL